jgi:hypothetical protein
MQIHFIVSFSTLKGDVQLFVSTQTFHMYTPSFLFSLFISLTQTLEFHAQFQDFFSYLTVSSLHTGNNYLMFSFLPTSHDCHLLVEEISKQLSEISCGADR